jgi:hypothetical protein
MSIHAKDIPDQVINAMIRNGIRSLYDIQDGLHQYPPKVVKAKLAQMVNKGRLIGCGCGCRGDFEIPLSPEAGRAIRDARKRNGNSVQINHQN